MAKPLNVKSRLNLFQIQLIILSLGFVIGLLMSTSLWTTERSFPSFPVFEWMPTFSSINAWVVFALLLLSIAGIHLTQFKRQSIRLLIAILLILFLQDQQRWQPWAYQYFLMLLPLLWLSKKHDFKEENQIINLHRIVLIGVYLWGAIHKCNTGFISVFQNSMLGPITRNLDDGLLKSLMNATAYLVPVVELFIAIGLCIPKLRKPAVISALGTHIFILILLSPLVKNDFSNTVVWPWNICMMAMVFVLFWKEDLDRKFLQKGKLQIISVFISILFLLAPVLFYANAWDRYLSFNLYSGKQKRVIVYFDKNSVQKLPVEWQKYLKDVKGQEKYKAIPASAWALEEMNVPFVSENRNIKSFAQQICEQSNGVSPLFYIDYKHLPKKGKLMLNCNQLNKIDGF